MERTWHFLVNQFLMATIRSYKKALKLSNYHDAYLKKKMDDHPAEPDWATLYNRYHPFHVAYVAVYSDWKNAGGQQGGQTLNLDQMLTLLVSKASKWSITVQGVFEKNTLEYKALFPKGLKIFSNGAYIDRITAVQTLGTALAPHAALATLKTEVDNFYTALDNARDNQEGAKGDTKSGSTEVENGRQHIMTEQYRNLGFLINKGAQNPALIEPFFELSILRDHRQTLFTGTLDPAETEQVLIHTFVEDDELELNLTGETTVPAGTQVQLYLASIAGGTNSTPVNMTVNTGKQTIQASAFGALDFGTHRYLTIVNSTGYEMHYEIELL